ncbi:MAG: hypothetical protein OXH57_12750 [Ekhidna sp.]|nr:hypothetical protein [Ekhidna sp.]
MEISTISGNAHLTSKLEDGKVSGFSFEQKGVITLTSENQIDFLIFTLTNELASPVGSFLSSPNLDTEFASSTPADIRLNTDTFNEILAVPDSISNWENIAPVQTGEIWFVRTRNGKYGKLLLNEVSEITDREGTTVSSFAKFEWVFQPNGTRVF